MKKILLLLLLLIYNFCLGQEIPQVEYASTKNIVGTCNYNSVVHYTYYDTDKATLIEDTLKVTNGNKFVIKFKVEQEVGKIASIWASYKQLKIRTITTEKKPYTILSDSAIVNIVVTNESKNESSYIEEVEAINELKAEKEALKNTTLTYAGQIISTNFAIPLVRFNLVKNDNTKQGDILLFTSIGAGIGYYFGRLERTRDYTGEIINEEFSNSFGISLGALFSAGTGDDTKNVFAPVVNLSLLDFQIGVGYELGTLEPNQKKEFITLSYAIPLYKLFKKAYRLTSVTPRPYKLTQKTQD